MGSASAPARQVLGQLEPGRNGDDKWLVDRFALGGQATLFRACRASCDDEVIVKLYKSDVPRPADVARDEYESLQRLHARLDGVTLHGWRVRCPRPLLLTESPFGLVVTRVPGAPLSTLLRDRTSPSDPEAFRSLAPAIAAALERYWAGEPRLYGDVRFNNILCDPATRQLSFIDPGKPYESFHCDGVSREWYPASRDLAYLLYSAAVAVRATLGRPRARRDMIDLAARVLGSVLDGAGTATGRGHLLDEVAACAQAHLDMIPVVGASPAGWWRRIVRATAARGIDRALNGFGGTLAYSGAVALGGLPCETGDAGAGRRSRQLGSRVTPTGPSGFHQTTVKQP